MTKLKRYFILACLLYNANSFAATDLADQPLFTGVPNNVMFILDNSGSMSWNFLPDNISSASSNNSTYYFTDNNGSQRAKFGCKASNSSTSTVCGGGATTLYPFTGMNDAMTNGGDPPFLSAQINKVYYNPNISYTPAVNPCSLSSNLPSMTDATRVRVNGHDINSTCAQTSATVNISIAFPERVYCNQTLTTCKRNGIDNPANTNDYYYPNNTGSNPYAPTTYDTYSYPKTIISNPHYYNVTPTEYCQASDLKVCNVQSTAANGYTYPAYVRYCTSGTEAGKTVNPTAGTCKAFYDDTNGFVYARYGSFDRVDIVSSRATYPKSSGRTDCITSANSCSYNEELINFSNWYAYYRTRIQTVKSSASLAFQNIDNNYRIGFITINGKQFLPIANFDSASGGQKEKWYKTLYDADPTDGSGTPLREGLARVGRYYAGKSDGINSMTKDDPVQYSCQKNNTILTTDGYWNGNAGVQINGSSLVGNQDGVDSGYSKRADGAYDALGASDSLADVAMYYYKTDLRPTMAASSQLTSATDSNSEQHMVTYTLGLGLSGQLQYDANYKLPTGDFKDIISGTKNWPLPAEEDPSAIDDLWHAAVNGRGTYFSSSDPVSVTNGLKGALTLPPSTNAKATSSPLVSSGSLVYSSEYTPNVWTGNVIASKVDANGGTTKIWQAADNLETQNWNSGRIIATSECTLDAGTNGTQSCKGKLFRIDSGNVDAIQPSIFNTALAYKLATTPADQTTMLNYLRGDRTYEGTKYRSRSKLLGDIVNSKVVVLPAPGAPYSESANPGYTAFKASYATRPSVAYVGANDGMLHAFDAREGKGQELFAYVPNALFAGPNNTPNTDGLASLSNNAFVHHYFVDAPPLIRDVNFGGGSSDWHSLLVGGLGKGGKAYYALDISNPDGIQSENDLKSKVLWEFKHNNLGYSYSRPLIVKTKRYGWVVILTSGYNNSDGNGYFFVLDAKDGSLKQTIKTYASSPGTTNEAGLGGLTAFVTDVRDFTADAAYAGDLKGNLWRLDLTSTTSNYTATNIASVGKPITVSPVVEADPSTGKRYVFVGTGRLLASSDLSTSQSNTFYAFIDGTESAFFTSATLPSTPSQVSFPLTRSNLIDTTSTDGITGNVAANSMGYYIDLGSYRLNVEMKSAAGIILFAVNKPDTDVCKTAGSARIYAVTYSSGKSVLLGSNGATVKYVDSNSMIAGLSLYNSSSSSGITLYGSAITVDGTQLKLPLQSGSALGYTQLNWREVPTSQ